MPEKRLPIINLASKELADIKLPGMEVLDGTVYVCPGRILPTLVPIHVMMKYDSSLKDFKISF